MNVPNAYVCEYDKIEHHLEPREPVRITMGESEKRAWFGERVVLTRRWVHMPGHGEGAVWCDDDGRTYGPICFAGQRTMPAPEELAEPEGGW